MSLLWEEKGHPNTEETLKTALQRSKELGINNLVLSSNSGETIKTLLSLINGLGLNASKLIIVCVTHHVGFKGPGVDEMAPEIRTQLTEAGVKILTTTHLFAGLDRAVRNKFGGVYPAEIMAQTLRIFGQGVKVAVEVAGMALDAGLIPHGEEVISIGGYNTGADSAIVIIPAHSNKFFDTEVREIICMPRKK
jgi:uncharacterized protein